ncbi:IS256 family transposase [Limnoglobus roseus]|uniref:IS256 family transposase n=1 Tax=Limnoglobus roseus TaxID=2598579 RepID=A0A5C1ACA9_9BACT|nr:IS256 family transposase [Limnoglobus roseus]
MPLGTAHLVRAALRSVAGKDRRAVDADLGSIYQAAMAREAGMAMSKSAEVWGGQSPTIVKWRRVEWADVVAMFE